MTMDIANQQLGPSEIKLSPKISTEPRSSSSPSPTMTASNKHIYSDYLINNSTRSVDSKVSKSGKRSFDVAFLMLPDEKLKHKQCEKHFRFNNNNTSDAVVTHQASHDLSPQTHQIMVKSDASLRQRLPSTSDVEVEEDVDEPLGEITDRNIAVLQPRQHIYYNSHSNHHTNRFYSSSSTSSSTTHSNGSSPDQITDVRKYFSSPQISYCNSNQQQPIVQRSPRIYDDPSNILGTCPTISSMPDQTSIHEEDVEDCDGDGILEPLKSAFTKVSQSSSTRSGLDSPLPSISPDQRSCPSNSPPLSNLPDRCSPIAVPATSRNMIYHAFRPEYQFLNGSHQFHHAVAAAAAHQHQSSVAVAAAAAAVLQNNTTGGQHYGGKFIQKHHQPFIYRNLHNHPNGHIPSTLVQSISPTAIPISSSNTKPLHQQSLSHSSLSGPPSGYLPASAFPFGPNNNHQFIAGNHHHHSVHQPPSAPNDLPGIVRNPAAAAALLTTLIPPTIATTFTLTAQNVCAKCNISFRMTSDLVYHMRSHHKSEYSCDSSRRKREEKLKCPVCNESFRERHHLTRHMTAHQDKDSDETEPKLLSHQRRQSHK